MLEDSKGDVMFDTAIDSHRYLARYTATGLKGWQVLVSQWMESHTYRSTPWNKTLCRIVSWEQSIYKAAEIVKLRIYCMKLAIGLAVISIMSPSPSP